LPGIEALEESGKPVWVFVLLFLLAVTVRNLIEPFSTGYGWSLRFQALYYAWYVGLVTALVPLVHWVTEEQVPKVIKVAAVASTAVILAPIVDLLWNGGFQLEFFMPHKDNLWERYLFVLFVPDKEPGFSPGQRVEVFIILFFIFLYFLVKTRKFLRSLLGLFAVYNLIFIFGALPFILYWLSLLLRTDMPSNRTLLLTRLCLIFFFVAVNALAHAWDRAVYGAVVKNLRWLRIGHYVLVLVLGMTLGGASLAEMDLDLLLNFPLTVIAVLFAALYSIIVNDIHDVKIDEISNSERPLITGAIRPDQYVDISRFSLGMALLFALAAGRTTLFAIAAVMALYHLYSAPPVRFKRMLYLSKFVISINTTLMLLLGFHAAGGEWGSFPVPLLAFVLLVCTACMNFIDIKDYEGDKKSGIRTLVTALGLKRSQKIIGLSFLLAYGLAPFSSSFLPFAVSKCMLTVISMLFGCSLFFLLVRKNYNERPVFLLYETSLVLMILSLDMTG
jgi:4-hydroxybenzoate polyprenyltransferase